MSQVEAEPAERPSSADDEAFFNLSPDPICVGTIDGRITRVNPAYTRDVGYTLADLHQMRFLDLVHPDDHDYVVQGLTSLFSGGGAQRSEPFRIRRKDGVYRWFDWTAKLSSDKQKFFSIGRDVTELRENSQRLADSQALLERVLNGVSDGVVAAQAIRDDERRIVDFRVTAANRSASEILGRPSQELVGTRISELFTSAIDGQDLERLKQVVETGRPFDQERRYEIHDRPALWMELTASRLGDGFVATFRDVTARKKAEAEVLERTAAMQSIVASALDGIVTIDDEAIITSFNPAAEKIFGWKAEEIIGRSLTLLCPPSFEGRTPLLVRLVKASAGRIVGRRRQLLVQRRDGSTFSMELSIGAYEHGGKTVHVGVLRDVSEERAAAQRTADANARFAIVETASNSGVWDWDLRTNELFITPLWKAQLGYEPHELTDGFVEWSSRLHPDDRARCFQVVDDYVHGRIPRYELEHRLLHRDGTYRTMLARGLLQRDSDGRPSHFVGANTDVTVLKESERARQDSERALQQVFDACTEVAVVAVGPDGIVKVFNKGAERLLGYAAEEVVDKFTPALWHVDEEIAEHARVMSATLGRQFEGLEVITAIAAAQGSHEGEWTQRRKDGSLINVHLIVTATRGSDGQINGFMGVSRNITEEKAAIEALRRSNTDLRDAHRMLEAQARELQAKATQLEEARREADLANLAKSEFLANMSHEIRTPMTAVLGYAQMLLAGEPSPEDRVEWIQGIERNGSHLLALINDVLDLSKIEAGKMHVELIETPLLRFVAEVDSLMRARAQQKGLEFDVVFRTTLPETVETDPVRLRQVLVNLLGNAIKFTHEGSVKVIVGLDGAQLRFDVVDTGVGMTPQQVAALFRPFTQADASTTRMFGGTGLGLTISRRLTELLGGRIYVRSDEGKGSVFSATIAPGDLADAKLVEMSLSAPTEPAPLEERARAPLPKLSGRVLLAEDGPDNRRVIAFHLEKVGLNVAFAENGCDAVDDCLAAWRAGTPYDLILMDLQMPKLDGYGAVRALRSAGYPGPIIALTAHALTGDREKCLEVGCNDYATKPIDKHRLIATIARNLPRKANQ